MKPLRSAGPVIVVGPVTPTRWMVMQQLLADGRPVLSCTAEACPLDEGEGCPLRRVADTTIAVPGAAGSQVRRRMQRCVSTSRFGYSLEKLGDVHPGQMLHHVPAPSGTPADDGRSSPEPERSKSRESKVEQTHTEEAS